MKIVAIVQARMNSSRLPGKVMRKINGVPLIELLLQRLSCCKEVNQVILATSTDYQNNKLVDHVKKVGISVFCGDEDDVLGRYWQAAKEYDADVIVRITGDCPLIDPVIVDKCVVLFKEKNVDYVSNIQPPTFPDGLDVEVFSMSVLDRAHKNANKLYEREHVTPYIRECDTFSKYCYEYTTDLSALRWTVDDLMDFKVIQNIFDNFSPSITFGWNDVLELNNSRPELFSLNANTVRNQGAKLESGQKLWIRAKNVIPGGNSLLSKRSEMFLPEQWPSYFKKSKGCYVWDLDEKQYVDMTIMGVGTNTLGYGHEEVDQAVLDVVFSGNMSTLNCPEEVYLAEKLIEINQWADMVRFARTGGEANAIAIRIARAASGKDKVAVCGYHGWHDWYLSANLGYEKNLDGHLLPGLATNGVPRNLVNSIYTFNYNDLEGFKKLIDEQDIGVVKMEVVRNLGPQNSFLQIIRDICTQKNIVLIFDECTSGFRETYGGIHQKYGVYPDMAVYGKALGNGYPVTAVVGKRDVMEAGQSTFISSTFWTERIGSAAGLRTLDVMAKVKSWEIITEIGRKVQSGWIDLAAKYDLPLTISGIPALSSFSIKSDNFLPYKTLITQEMLKKGILASNMVYTCISHTDQILDQYFESLDPIFKLISDCEDGRNVADLLDGPVCHAGFKRLN